MIYPVTNNINSFSFKLNNNSEPNNIRISNNEKASYCSNNQTNIKFTNILGKDISKDTKYKNIYRTIKKVNGELVKKGYEPCNEFIINSNITTHWGTSDAAARYLQKLNKIVIDPKALEKITQKELEYLIVHEQAHCLHHKKYKQYGKIFKPEKLAQEEKKILFKAFNETLNPNNDKSSNDTIENIHLANNLEFVGYYFASKYFGNDFGENAENIYKKYLGP